MSLVTLMTAWIALALPTGYYGVYWFISEDECPGDRILSAIMGGFFFPMTWIVLFLLHYLYSPPSPDGEGEEIPAPDEIGAFFVF